MGRPTHISESLFEAACDLGIAERQHRVMDAIADYQRRRPRRGRERNRRSVKKGQLGLFRT